LLGRSIKWSQDYHRLDDRPRVDFGLGSVGKTALRIIYNASDSAPRGLYTVSPAAALQVGDCVVARLPEATARSQERAAIYPFCASSETACRAPRTAGLHQKQFGLRGRNCGRTNAE
jgi:hypothetical protein